MAPKFVKIVGDEATVGCVSRRRKKEAGEDDYMMRRGRGWREGVK